MISGIHCDFIENAYKITLFFASEFFGMFSVPSNPIKQIALIIVIGFIAMPLLWANDSSKSMLAAESKLWLETEINQLLDDVDSKHEKFDSNELNLKNYLIENALIYWDTAKMAKGLAGSHWYKSEKTQKTQLENEWKRTILRYYLRAYSDYYQQQRLSLNEYFNCPGNNRCWLRTQVEISGKKLVELDFYVRKTKKRGWQLIDLRVAGVSLFKHKQAEFRQLLNENGINAVIQSLKKKNDEKLNNIQINTAS